MEVLQADIAFMFAFLICYGDLDGPLNNTFLLKLGINTFMACLFFYLLRTYRSAIRFSGIRDILRVFMAIFAINVSMFIISKLSLMLWSMRILPAYGFLLSAAFCFSLIFMAKMTIKLLYDYAKTRTETKIEKNIPLLIYDVSPNNIRLAALLENSQNHTYKIRGFLLLGRTVADKMVNGIPVYCRWKGLQKLVDNGECKSLLINPEEIDRTMKAKIADYCIKWKIELLTAPSVGYWKAISNTAPKLKKIRIEELLGRTTINIENSTVGTSHSGKCVLISGAAGSIGSEIVRQVCMLNPRSVVLCDIAETPMHNLQLELDAKFPELNINLEIADVRNRRRMEQIFETYAPEYVYHAAAYKHVPLMEKYPCEAVITNVLGTKIMADLSVLYKVKYFVMVSTDKAVNPTNVMGTTKRVAEIYVQSLGLKLKHSSIEGHCHFITTRFGNVLGSSGSVIPYFEEQIKQGGPVTVTHPEITRFFMTIPEACSLVLEAGTMGEGGEIFVFDMGEPVKIKDMAEEMIKLSGLIPYRDIDIEYTGLRQGEKLYEEILYDKDNVSCCTENKKIMIGKIRYHDETIVLPRYDALCELCETSDNLSVVRKIKEIVPEFISKNSEYEILDKKN